MLSYTDLREAIARGWCAVANSNKEMECVLADAIAVEVMAMLKLIDDQKSSTNNLSCQSCKREHCNRSNPTCMACLRFNGERIDWHDVVGLVNVQPTDVCYGCIYDGMCIYPHPCVVDGKSCRVAQ